jgi:Zn-finger nucleic acid-binding protein
MRTMDRSGVVLERCSECGGIFLDRGELERLMRAESEYNAHQPRGFRDDDDDYDDDYREHGHQGRPRKRRRKNFLEDLFDFG